MLLCSQKKKIKSISLNFFDIKIEKFIPRFQKTTYRFLAKPNPLKYINGLSLIILRHNFFFKFYNCILN